MMDTVLAHEKLHVYQHGLQFVSWKEALLSEVDQPAAALDHLSRASESIVEAIANGNSRRSKQNRNRYLNIAIGSGLECAACLDVCECKHVISIDTTMAGKKHVQRIVRMTIGLRDSPPSHLKEESASYVTNNGNGEECLFSHEALDVYKLGLGLVRWTHTLIQDGDITTRNSGELDKSTTSFVLNLAEGNGRFSNDDQKKFLDIAHTSLIKTAARLDLLVAKGSIPAEDVDEGKRILSRLVPMTLGLRGYLDQDADPPD